MLQNINQTIGKNIYEHRITFSMTWEYLDKKLNIAALDSVKETVN